MVLIIVSLEIFPFVFTFSVLVSSSFSSLDSDCAKFVKAHNKRIIVIMIYKFFIGRLIYLVLKNYKKTSTIEVKKINKIRVQNVNFADQSIIQDEFYKLFFLGI